MWISSTATPAASDGSESAREERKTSIGRRRLPPADRASEPTAAATPGWLATVSCSRSSSSSRYDSSPGASRIEASTVTARPRCAARRCRPRGPVGDVPEAGGAEQPGELLRAGKAPDARGQIGVGGPALQRLAEQRDDMVEPEPVERRQRPRGRRDLENAEPAVGSQDAPELDERGGKVGDVTDAEADRGGIEARVRERQREQVPFDPGNRLLLGAGALQHAGREVEPHDLTGAGLHGGHGEITGAAAAVEHAIARPHDRLHRLPAPALVETGGHHAVHQVVDRRDAVEHRPDLRCVQPSGLDGHGCPHRRVIECSRPSWSRQRATTKSTRSSTVSAPW